MGSNYRKELEAGVPGGSIPSGGAVGEGVLEARVAPQPPKLAAPLSAAQKAARDAANRQVQKTLSKEGKRAPKVKKSYSDDRDELSGQINFGSTPTEDWEAAGFSEYKKGGKVSSASKRADGCATRGKTKGKMV